MKSNTATQSAKASEGSLSQLGVLAGRQASNQLATISQPNEPMSQESRVVFSGLLRHGENLCLVPLLFCSIFVVDAYVLKENPPFPTTKKNIEAFC